MNENKTFQFIILILFVLTASSFKPQTIGQAITGKIFQVIDNKKKPIAWLRIFIIANKKIRVAEAITDKNGYYNIAFDTWNLPEKSKFDFLVTKKGMDTIFLKSFSYFESEEVTRNFKLPHALKKR